MFFFYFRHALSKVPRPIAAKLRHMIGNCLNFIIQVQKFGRPSPKKIWGQKHAKFRSILYNLRLWPRISPERLKISKIGKLMFPDRLLLRSMKKVRWTLTHKLQRSGCEFGPTKMHFFGNYISAIRGCCALKFLHALQIDQALLAHTQTRRGSPPKIFNRENLKFGLKFSVWAPITFELVGASSQNFYQTTCRESVVIKYV